MPSPLSDVELLRRLVAFDTTSELSNLPIADFICEYLERPGVTIFRNDSPDGTKANVIVRLGELHPGGHGLVLSGHLDCVPALEAGWTSSPFELAERDGNLFARGAADMKGFVAVAMNAFLRASERPPDKPLVLLFTYEEETGTIGARRFVETWSEPLPRKTIIGEPTSLRVVHAHKGHLRLLLTLHGRSAHSGYPHLGRNAIEIAARVVDALSDLRRTLESERPANASLFPEVPFVPLNIATVRGGTAINIVPDRCEIEIGLRLLPGMDTEAMLNRLREVVTRVTMSDEILIEVVSDSPPMMIAPDNVFHREICDVIGQSGTSAVNYATDAGWFQTIAMECVLFGPGSIEVAHRPDEFVPIHELERAAHLLDQLIEVTRR